MTDVAFSCQVRKLFLILLNVGKQVRRFQIILIRFWRVRLKLLLAEEFTYAADLKLIQTTV